MKFRGCRWCTRAAPSALDLNPNPHTFNPNPEPRNPKFGTSHRQPHTLNPVPQSPNPKLQILHSESQNPDLNPKSTSSVPVLICPLERRWVRFSPGTCTRLVVCLSVPVKWTGITHPVQSAGSQGSCCILNPKPNIKTQTPTSNPKSRNPNSKP